MSSNITSITKQTNFKSSSLKSGRASSSGASEWKRTGDVIGEMPLQLPYSVFGKGLWTALKLALHIESVRVDYPHFAVNFDFTEKLF